MEEKRCTGDCLKCSFQQQVYCAAQHGHAIMTFLPGIIERLDRIENEMAKFGQADIINPLKKEDEAQKDPGAENRGSSKTI